MARTRCEHAAGGVGAGRFAFCVWVFAAFLVVAAPMTVDAMPVMNLGGEWNLMLMQNPPEACEWTGQMMLTPTGMGGMDFIGTVKLKLVSGSMCPSAVSGMVSGMVNGLGIMFELTESPLGKMVMFEGLMAEDGRFASGGYANEATGSWSAAKLTPAAAPALSHHALFVLCALLFAGGIHSVRRRLVTS